MPHVPAYLQSAIAFDTAATDREKSQAVDELLNRGEMLYAQHGDPIYNNKAEDEKSLISAGLKELHPNTQNVVKIVRKAIMAKILLGMNKSTLYNEGIDDLLANHLVPAAAPDEFATAQIALNYATADMAHKNINALNKTMEFAYILAQCPNQEHFANEDGDTNQDEAISLVRHGANTAQEVHKMGHISDEVLVTFASSKYGLLLSLKETEVAQQEWEKDTQKNPELAEAFYRQNQKEMVETIRRDHPNVAAPAGYKLH